MSNPSRKIDFSDTAMNLFNMNATRLVALCKVNHLKDTLATRQAQQTGTWPYPQIKAEITRICQEYR